jgi:hypothetical protein
LPSSMRPPARALAGASNLREKSPITCCTDATSGAGHARRSGLDARWLAQSLAVRGFAARPGA